jgi:hypothetical protein
MKNIIISIPTRSTTDRLIQAVTTQAGLAAWLTPDVQLQPKIGSIGKLGFGPGFAFSFRLERVDQAGLVEWIITDGPEEWKGTRFIFEAKADGSTIYFTFTHGGLPEGYPMESFLTYCWANHIRSLKLLLETGAGEPYGSAASRAWHPLGYT